MYNTFHMPKPETCENCTKTGIDIIRCEEITFVAPEDIWSLRCAKPSVAAEADASVPKVYNENAPRLSTHYGSLRIPPLGIPVEALQFIHTDVES